MDIHGLLGCKHLDCSITIITSTQDSFESDKYHSDHFHTLRMNLVTNLPFTLNYFISFILQSVFYGKHRPTIAFGADTDLKALSYTRYIFRDIRSFR